MAGKMQSFSRMMSGSPILLGSYTTPGVRIPPELQKHIPTVMEACRASGLDFFPAVVEPLTYDEISEIAAYGGFPVRYPHWRFGMEYEELSKGYEYGMHRIYELVINNDPCYIYLLASNTLADNLTVIAHALAHNDFFKNNVFFGKTNRNMMNKMANHGTRIRQYMARWGKERVLEFIDHALRIDDLIDPFQAWSDREYKPARVKDERHWRFPERRPVAEGRNYMEPWLNPRNHIDHEWEKIREKEAAEELGLLSKPEKNIFGYLKDYAPLKPWEQDIMSMLYEEAMYFHPQGETKTLNEGWASYWDMEIMCGQGLISLGQEDANGGGVVEYSKYKWGVLGGKYSVNPYKLGFLLLREIEDRWNKGKFGPEYEDCRDLHQRENWDQKLGLGRQKIFEVRKYHNDLTAISTFFDQDFCDKYEFFEWEKLPNGNIQIAEDGRNAKRIKKRLLERYANLGLPEIRLTDPNHLGRGWLCLEHQYDGRALHDPYARQTLMSMRAIWRNTVVLSTRGKDGKEYVYVAEGTEPTDVARVDRETYERTFMGKGTPRKD